MFTYKYMYIYIYNINILQIQLFLSYEEHAVVVKNKTISLRKPRKEVFHYLKHVDFQKF